jgi:hypothetical protein
MAIGMVSGYALRQKLRPMVTPIVVPATTSAESDEVASRGTAEMRRCLNEATSLLDQAKHLCLVCSVHQPVIAQTVVDAAQHLTDATVLLQEHIQSAHNTYQELVRMHKALEHHSATALASNAAAVDTQRLAQAAELSSSELKTIAVAANASAQSTTTDLGTQRFVYSAKQYVAPCHDGVLPLADSFEQVRCNDLSSGGVSFLSARAPDYQSVVVSVGTAPHLIFILAQVQHQHVVPTEEGQQYLVGCRFIERLDNRVYHWDLSRKRIVSSGPNPKLAAAK